MNLLIAESDFRLANALKPHFEAENYGVDTARDTVLQHYHPACSANYRSAGETAAELPGDN